ncbi:MAG: 3-oxoacyl-[acyl-carrier-protein] synthase 2 [Phycisphaerae bacterium]|nr:3-oxoacyl-[acyl-carrier-protein] synthase 2 [Phycisphaerae bacterium]
MGVVTALGETLDTYWENLVAGRSGIRRISRIDASPFASQVGGECTDFDPARYVDHREIKRLDRFAHFAMAAGTMAVTDSGLDFSKENDLRCGVMVGSGVGGIETIEQQHERMLEKGADRLSPFTVPKMMVNAASGNLSIIYGLRGPNSAVATACASAANAIGDAFRIIARGEADVMITGGSEAALTKIGVGAFSAMKALSTRNGDPEHASRPFDKDRDGFVIAEGAGIVVLEEYEHARKRGARIYAEMVGYGMSGDGSHITAPEPAGKGAAVSMRAALADAGLNVDQVDYVNAHGTATPLGDVAETNAVKSVFGPQAYKVAISSTKSMLGHLLGASGGVELVATVLGMNRGAIHPTMNLDNPDPECDLDYVPRTAREMTVNVAMSNSFGFGGHNASLLVRSVQ